MAEGKANVNILGREGLVGHHSAPTWDFLYQVSSVKDSKWDVGDRVILPDGREFRYGRSTGAAALFAAHGCEFTYTGLVSYTAFATGHAVGVNEITIPAATHAALTKDELRGGYVIIFDGATDLGTCTRRIIGNDVSAADVAFDVRLDASITNAIVSGTEAVEVYRNPYYALTVASDAAKPKAGLPASYVSAAAQYFWVQTKGICWISPQTNVGENGGLGCYWRHDGSLEGAEVTLGGLTVPAYDTSQYAGYVIAGSQSGNGPLFMLDI